MILEFSERVILMAGKQLPPQVRLSSRLFAGSAAAALLITIAAIAAERHLDSAVGTYAPELATMEDADAWETALRFSMRYQLVAAIVAGVPAAALAFLTRGPDRRWVQAAGVLTAVLTWLGVGTSMAGGPEVATDAGRLEELLLAPWYPTAHSILALVSLAAATTAAVLLFRGDAPEFYRPTRSEGDPRWNAVLQARANRQDSAAPGA